MNALHSIMHAMWNHDFSVLAQGEVIWVVYAIMFGTLLLENGLLPAAFLPGDSLILLAGAMVAKGVMGYLPALILLTCAASLGCWLSYLQGRWLGNRSWFKSWLLRIPQAYQQRAWSLFHRHGLAALLFGRFLAFVRTILPTMAGISGLSTSRFQLFNWLSGLLWVGILLTAGYGMSQIPFIRAHEDQVMLLLMIIPVVLMVVGLVSSITLIMKHKKACKNDSL
ncbi:MAG: Inner membrane protein YghB [Candidatus Erwinia impunctatus]|nr:Inner membrane protein YghB [Culicoides impunctatus]